MSFRLPLLTTLTLIISFTLFSQELDMNQRITISSNNNSYEDFLDRLTSDYGVSFSYCNQHLPLGEKVELNYEDAPLEIITQDLAKLAGVNYSVINNQIVFFNENKPDCDEEDPIEPLNINSFSTEIEGRIVDKVTQQPLPFANLSIKGTNRGTSCNEDGYFTIQPNSLPAIFQITYVGYEDMEIEVAHYTSDLLIELNPTSVGIDAAIIKGTHTGEFCDRLITNAYYKIRKNSNKHNFGKGFYRQSATNDNDPTEIFELFFDMKTNRSGIEKMQLDQGRYALRADLYQKNYIYYINFSRMLPIIRTSIDDWGHSPVGRNPGIWCDLKYIDQITYLGRDVSIIQCIPKIQGEGTRATLYIDTENYDLLKVSAIMPIDDPDMFKIIRDNNSYLKDQILHYEIAYKYAENGSLILDYIYFNHSFHHKKHKSFNRKVEAKGILTFYQYDEYIKKKKLKFFSDNILSDIDLINEKGYDKSFWDDNPIVKRTPVEQDLIESFEQIGAFGTLSFTRSNEERLEQVSIERIPSLLSTFADSAILNNPNEKVYVKLNNNDFIVGDQIYFSAFITDGFDHSMQPLSDILYVELINAEGAVIDRKKMDCSRGVASGSFDLPELYESGAYQIRAYTNWQRNYGTQWFCINYINIFNPKSIEASFDVDYEIVRNSNDAIEIYVQCLDPKLISLNTSEYQFNCKGGQSDKKKLYLDKNGKAIITENLPILESPIDAQLKIFYNDGRRNKTLDYLIPIDNQFNIQFYPEGHSILANRKSRVGFIVKDRTDKLININGQIVDNEDNIICDFKTLTKGYGIIEFIPETNKKYYAKIQGTSNSFIKKELPPVNGEGFALQIDNKDENLKFSVYKNCKTDTTDRVPFILTGQVRGQVFYAKKLLLNPDYAIFEISKRYFPTGLVKFTIFNEEGDAFCERMVFVDRKDDIKFKISQSSQQPIDSMLFLTIETRDYKGNPLSSYLSIRVGNDDLQIKHNIKWDMLLKSELNTENSDLYNIIRNSDNIDDVNDFLIPAICNRFSWEQIISQSYGKKHFSAESKFTLKGKATKHKRRKEITQNNITMMLFSDSTYTQTVNPEPDSTFRFMLPVFNDSLQVLLQAKNKKNKYVDLGLELLNDPIPEVNINKLELRKSAKYRLRKYSQLINSPLINTENIAFNDQRMKSEMKMMHESREGYENPSMDSDLTLIHYLRTYEGLRIENMELPGRAPKHLVRFIGRDISSDSIPPLFIFNGVELSIYDALSRMESITMREVDGLEVLKGNEASIYGSKGSNGAIIVTTKSIIAKDYVIPGSKKFYYFGYDLSKQFIIKQNNWHKALSISNTVHWIPVIETDIEGKVTVGIPKPATQETIKMQIDGMSFRGMVGTTTKEIFIE